MPRVAVIIPCFQGVRFLAEAVASVQAQTFPYWELVLVDDGSTDGTLALAHRLAANDPRLRVLSQPNGGQSRARNLGAAHVSPSVEFLYFLDQDDLLRPRALERLVAELDAHPSAGLVSAEKTDLDAAGQPLPNTPARRWAPGLLGWPRRLRPTDAVTPFVTYFCGTGGGLWVLYRRSVFEAVGGWDPAFQGFEDNDLLARVSLKTEARHVPEVLAGWRRHPDQTSRRAELIGAMYHRLRAKWTAFPAADAREARLLAHARRFQRFVHEPGRHLRLCATIAREWLRAPRAADAARFVTHLVSAVQAPFGSGETGDRKAPHPGPLPIGWGEGGHRPGEGHPAFLSPVPLPPTLPT